MLSEVFRVLRPGGRLQMAAILLHDDVTAGKLMVSQGIRAGLCESVAECALLYVLSRVGVTGSDHRGHRLRICFEVVEFANSSCAPQSL